MRGGEEEGRVWHDHQVEVQRRTLQGSREGRGWGPLGLFICLLQLIGGTIP